MPLSGEKKSRKLCTRAVPEDEKGESRRGNNQVMRFTVTLHPFQPVHKDGMNDSYASSVSIPSVFKSSTSRFGNSTTYFKRLFTHLGSTGRKEADLSSPKDLQKIPALKVKANRIPA
jgi:hypothetical protein